MPTTTSTTSTTSTASSTTLRAPVCGNKIPEPGEACDGGDCCHACMLAKEGTLCRNAASECRINSQCDGQHPDCPDFGYAPNSSTCIPATKACSIGACRDGVCEPKLQLRRSVCQVDVTPKTLKRPQKERAIAVVCQTESDAGCDAEGQESSDGPRATNAGGPVITVPWKRETKPHQKGFRTKVFLKLTEAGRQLLQKANLPVDVTVLIHERGGSELSRVLLKRLPHF